LLNQTNDSIYRIRRGNAADKEKQFLEAARGFISAFNCAKESRALCYLIDQKELGELLTRYVDTIEEVVIHYGQHGLSTMPLNLTPSVKGELPSSARS
jgi:hypothetical protein